MILNQLLMILDALLEARQIAPEPWNAWKVYLL